MFVFIPGLKRYRKKDEIRSVSQPCHMSVDGIDRIAELCPGYPFPGLHRIIKIFACDCSDGQIVEKPFPEDQLFKKMQGSR